MDSNDPRSATSVDWEGDELGEAIRYDPREKLLIIVSYWLIFV